MDSALPKLFREKTVFQCCQKAMIDLFNQTGPSRTKAGRRSRSTHFSAPCRAREVLRLPKLSLKTASSLCFSILWYPLIRSTSYCTVCLKPLILHCGCTVVTLRHSYCTAVAYSYMNFYMAYIALNNNIVTGYKSTVLYLKSEEILKNLCGWWQSTVNSVCPN